MYCSVPHNILYYCNYEHVINPLTATGILLWYAKHSKYHLFYNQNKN